MYTVEKANSYIQNYKVKENDVYRPKYHFAPKTGWCNDPHGLVYFNGKWIMFFQYSVYTLYNDKVHWGYVTTEDFVHFDEVRVAIAPDQDYDNNGCWSGSVLIKDDTLYIFYTGFALRDDGKYYQTVCLATSKDGVNFQKSPLNPVIDESLIPDFANLYDFRDPCVFKENDKYYIILGSKNKKEAMTLLYESDDLTTWKFVKPLIKTGDLGTMFECPNLIRFDNKAYLVMSPQDVPMKDDNFFNVSSCVYVPMDRDFIHKDVNSIKGVKEIDHGFDYYAPNVCDEEKILVSWSQLWGRRYYLQEINSDFINSFSLFRKIEQTKNGKLRFVPLDVYRKYFVDKKRYSCTLKPREFIRKTFGLQYHFDLSFKTEFDMFFELELAKNDDECVKLCLDCRKKLVTIDRSGLKQQLYGVDNTPSTKGFRYLKLKRLPKIFKLEVYVDAETIEIYLNNYEDSFNLLSFSMGKDIAIRSNKETKIKLIKHNIEV